MTLKMPELNNLAPRSVRIWLDALIANKEAPDEVKWGGLALMADMLHYRRTFSRATDDQLASAVRVLMEMHGDLARCRDFLIGIARNEHFRHPGHERAGR